MVLLHSICVDGMNIDKEVLLSLDHVKVGGILKPVPERAIDKVGFLVFLIWVAATPVLEFLARHLSHLLATWLRPVGSLLLERRIST